MTFRADAWYLPVSGVVFVVACAAWPAPSVAPEQAIVAMRVTCAALPEPANRDKCAAAVDEVERLAAAAER